MSSDIKKLIQCFRWNKSYWKSKFKFRRRRLLNQLNILNLNNGDYNWSVSASVYITQTGILTIVDNDDLSIYPNPACDNINIDINREVEIVKIEIFSLIGEKVLEINSSGITNNIVLDIHSLKSGIYTIRLYM